MATLDPNSNLRREEEARRAAPEYYYHEEEHRLANALAIGSSVEATGGAAVIALAIIGLSGYLPEWMMPVSAIVAGAVVFLQRGALAGMLPSFLSRVPISKRTETMLESSAVIEALGGAAALVLGILAVIGIVPVTLTAIAAICLGVTFVLGDAEKVRYDAFAPEGVSRTVHRASLAGGGTAATLGLAGAVLGILALVGIGPAPTHNLIAFLCLGAGMLLAGVARGVGMADVIRNTGH